MVLFERGWEEGLSRSRVDWRSRKSRKLESNRIQHETATNPEKVRREGNIPEKGSYLAETKQVQLTGRRIRADAPKKHATREVD